MTDLIKPPRFLTALLFFVLLAAVSRSQEESPEGGQMKVEYMMIFPDEKAPEIVKPEEENPFVALADLSVKEDSGSSEENRVKDMLLAMEVVGRSERPQGGYRIQLGDITLQEGMIVPSFLPDQSVHLRVNHISDSEIEFVWLEKQRTGLPPRTLLMPVRMKPVVRQMLPGQRGRDGTEPLFGVNEESLLKAAALVDSGGPKRGEVVDENATTAAPTAGQPEAAPRKKSAADAVLDMFFNQGGSIPSPR